MPFNEKTPSNKEHIMDNNTKTAIAVAVVAIAVVGATVQMKSLSNQVVERFPDIDPKVARKAYRKMMLKAAAGQYTDAELSDDAAMDKLFLVEAMKLDKK